MNNTPTILKSIKRAPITYGQSQFVGRSAFIKKLSIAIEYSPIPDDRMRDIERKLEQQLFNHLYGHLVNPIKELTDVARKLATLSESCLQEECERAIKELEAQFKLPER